ncbi:MAG: TonB-dependent receptor, partial [Gillisia sp.]
PYRSAPYRPLNLDKVVAENAANGADGAKTILYDSHNDHKWYGLISTLSTKPTEEITFTGGVDLRYYKGDHYHQVKDLLGGQYYADSSNKNDTLNLARTGAKIDYHNTNQVLWEGVFAQAEYAKNDLSAFISAAASNTGYQRTDYFNYLDSDPNQSTDFINFFGYSVKGGANYNITNSSNVFANVGYFEKAPFSNDVFQNYQNDVNANAKNQKIFSAELGYGYRTANLRANVNVYRTTWSDRTFVKSIPVQNGNALFANISGVNALHQGVEVDLDYQPVDRLHITGMASFGDWKWNNDVTNVIIYDENQQPVNADNPINVYISGVPVGNSAQTTMALGANFEVLPGTTIRGEFTYYDRFYADFDPLSRNEPDMANPTRMPDYGLLDLGLTHNFQFGPFEARLNANVFNLLDTEYIADATGGYNSVWYGFGRTWTVGTKINF